MKINPNKSPFYSSTKCQNESKHRLLKFRPLSTDELTQVNLATFREGVNHCRWPREVIEKFLAAQV